MENKITDDDLAKYAGRDFREPRLVLLGKLDLREIDDIDELIKAIVRFRKCHSGRVEIDRDDDDLGCIRSIVAYRSETPDEIEVRLAGWRKQLEDDRERRLRQYRAEFG